jgi:cobalt-zinc-cadmium efflux system membrane fusion protein
MNFKNFLLASLAGNLLAWPAIAFGGPAPDANRVILDETGVANLNLKTAPATTSNFEETAFALGVIRAAPGSKAVVSSRVPGRAISVSAYIDTKIERGAEAVHLETRQAGDPPPSVRLLAPISGYVSAVKVAPGQPIGVEDSLVEIIDLSSVHAVAALPEHLANRVQIGQRGRIRVLGYPDRDFEAEVEHIGTEADYETGSLEVAFHVENPETLLRPGMRAEFSIITNQRVGVLCVPPEAVQGDAIQRFVYIADPTLKGAFIKTPVVVGTQTDRQVEIKSGLAPGDEVVTRGAYALVFAGRGNTSLKEALDIAHGHAHAEDGSELPANSSKAASGDACCPVETGGHQGHAHKHDGGHGHAQSQDHKHGAAKNGHSHGHGEHGHSHYRLPLVVLIGGSAILALVLLLGRGFKFSNDNTK